MVVMQKVEGNIRYHGAEFQVLERQRHFDQHLLISQVQQIWEIYLCLHS